MAGHFGVSNRVGHLVGSEALTRRFKASVTNLLQFVDKIVHFTDKINNSVDEIH